MRNKPFVHWGAVLFTTTFFATLPALLRADDAKAPPHPIPAILDTDIGDDIDDTWALALLLRSPELDLKLAVGDYGRPQYRSRLLAKFLQTVGRADVAVGVGLDVKPSGEGGQAEWIRDYDLKSYSGKVFTNGVQAIIDTIMQSPEPVTLIATGPMPNLAAALLREPRIAEHARFVGMQGSVRIGYGGRKTPDAEWNVKADVKACQQAFTAPWDITITPLDTCGLVHLEGDLYARVRDSKDLLAATVMQNYRLWCTHGKPGSTDAEHHSSTLFDTVAVYLACPHDLCTMERLGIRVTNDGFTRIEDGAKQINVATQWKDLAAFKEFLVGRLTSSSR